MNWLNLEVKTRTAPEFVGSEPVNRATWLCLMLHCAEHETGGIIRNAATWGTRRWMQTCGVTKDEVAMKTELWSFEGSSLRLWGYPTEKEAEVAAKREGGRKGGRKAPRKALLEAQLTSTPSSSASNGKERKGKEIEGNRERETVEKNIPNKNVQAVIDCRPEFNNLRVESIAQILHNFSGDSNFSVKFDDFLCDAANAIDPPKNPTGMLRAYLGRADRANGSAKRKLVSEL